MIAEKVQIPRNMWDEYALCVNFDKESKQLEMALKFLQNAKSLSSLKKLMNSMTSSSGGGDLISKIRVQNFFNRIHLLISVKADREMHAFACSVICCTLG